MKNITETNLKHELAETNRQYDHHLEQWELNDFNVKYHARRCEELTLQRGTIECLGNVYFNWGI